MSTLTQNIVPILLTLSASAIMGFIFLKLKVPGGMLVGAIVGGAIINLGFQRGCMPSVMKTAAQITAGAFIGTMINKDDVKKLKSIYKVGSVVIGSYVLINILIGYLICFLSPYNLLTCLMCTIPGGMSDVPLIAADLGADVAPVVVVHFIRTTIGIGIFPSVIAYLGRHSDGLNGKEDIEITASDKNKTYDSKKVAITMVLAIAFGIIGKIVGIPVGALVFAMIGISAVKLMGFDAQIPRWIKRIAQALSGAYIGCSISRQSLAEIQSVIVPAIVVVAAYVINMLLVGRLINKKFKISLKESMLMLTPAGAGDMALISQDVGVASPSLITIHILRLFISDAILPQLCAVLASFS